MSGRSGLAALAASVPWCCVVPAALALAGLAGVQSARWVAVQAQPVLLVAAFALLVRAFWLVHVRRRGGRWSRRVVWASTLLAAVLWLARLL